MPRASVECGKSITRGVGDAPGVAVPGGKWMRGHHQSPSQRAPGLQGAAGTDLHAIAGRDGDGPLVAAATEAAGDLPLGA